MNDVVCVSACDIRACMFHHHFSIFNEYDKLLIKLTGTKKQQIYEKPIQKDIYSLYKYECVCVYIRMYVCVNFFNIFFIEFVCEYILKTICNQRIK